MRLLAILLLAACIQVSARGYSQNITLSVKNAPLEQVFNEIKKQSGYQFFFTESTLTKANPVTLEVTDQPVEEVLKKCFEGQPFSYAVVLKTVVVKDKMPEPPSAEVRKIEKGQSDDNEIRGRVLNENGEPLAGATVTIKRTKKGTITNAKGEFILHKIDASDEIIVSFIGHEPKTLKVGDDLQNIRVVLGIAKNELDKVVVQAYGTTNQRLTTSNIATVSKEEIERQPVVNPLLALQGRVAGLDITQTSGYGSAPLKVELRGRSLINGQFTSDPLYIIDGVPLTVLEVSGNSGYTTGSYGFIQSGIGGPANGQSPFFNINPLDIESIEVLKDADATAIYGSRGANGVILITTKKGKSGKTQFNIHFTQGINKVSRYWDMMDLHQYLSMRREAYKNDGYELSLNNGAYDFFQWDTTRNTNWQKLIFGGTGKNTDVELNLSGGDTRNTFRIGAGYTRTTSILTTSGADQRGSVSLNVGHQSIDRRLGIALSAGYSFTETDMISMPGSAVLLPPNAPAIFDSAGHANYNEWGSANTTGRSAYIFSGLFNPYSSKTNFLNSNLILNYQPVKGLKLATSFGYNNALAIQQFTTTIASQDPLYNSTGDAQFGNNRNANWIIEPQMTYDAMLGKGKLEVLVGGSVQHATTSGLQLHGFGYSNDDLLKTISNAKSVTTIDNYGEYRYAAIFGRINYSLKDKYIISLNARRDGSSRFGDGKQFGNFASVGAAWIFSEEDWFKEHFKFISFGKLRGSYGTTGSDAIGDYAYLTRWSSINTVPYANIRPLYPTQHADPNFQWQVQKKLEGAIELGFLKDNIRLSAVYYRDRCGNQLVQFPTPILSGFGSVAANSPALVQNSGVEFIASFKLINTKKVNWTVNYNMAINRNRLVAYPNLAQSPYANSLLVGKSLNIVNVYRYTGVNPLTGQYTFEDRNHDGQYNIILGNVKDDSYAYDMSPQFTGGLGSNFSYKRWNLALFFNIRKARGVNGYFATGGLFGTPNNAPAEIIGKEWRNPGDIATVARYTILPNSSLSGNSDLAYTDASFIRLSTLAISYSLPADLLKRAGMQNFSVFVHTNNLFTITKYMGMDPETQVFGSMPPNRTIVGGISIDF